MTVKSFNTETNVREYRFVKFADGFVTEANAATDTIIGVSNSSFGDMPDVCDVHLNGDIAHVTAGDAFSAGDALTTNEDGAAVKADDGDNIGAIALEDSTAADDIVQVVVTIGRTFDKPAEEPADDLGGE